MKPPSFPTYPDPAPESDGVLIVDDSATTRAVLARMLVSAGHVVWQASSAEEGLAVVKSRRPALVITDVDLNQGMNGIEFLHQVGRLSPGTGKILMSGSFPPWVREEHIPFPVLLKPVRMREFRALVATMAKVPA